MVLQLLAREDLEEVAAVEEGGVDAGGHRGLGVGLGPGPCQEVFLVTSWN